MVATSLREITVGVRDLGARTRSFETGCRLTVIRTGLLSSIAAGRLFDAHIPPRVTVLGRPDVEDSPRIRLIEAPEGPAARTQGLESPGPLGIGFTTIGIQEVQARLESSGVRFVSPPQRLPPGSATPPPGASQGAQRYEAFGRAADGDFIVLIERVLAPTPYGTFDIDCSEPLHASFVVTNLEACSHFMREVLQHEILFAESCSGPPFDALLGLPSDVAFRFSMPHRPGFPTGRTVFMEFHRKPEPMAHTPGLGLGICRLRYDTTDLHSTLSRLPGGGGSLVRGPASVDDPVLGQGLVAMVRSPFGVLIELWQTSQAS